MNISDAMIHIDESLSEEALAPRSKMPAKGRGGRFAKV